MIVATIEARMGSSRLPGKVLADIAGAPALQRLVERLRRVKQLDAIVVATTTGAADDAIVRLAERLGVQAYRGAEDDVLGRVVAAGASAGADVLVEVTGDCPLLAPEVLDEAIDVFARGGCDVVSNTWRASYPQGIDAQVFAWSLLDEAGRLTSDRAHREHVSLYFYEHPERYRICHLTAPPAYRRPELRCQLDTPEDLEFVRAIYGELFHERPDFSLPELFALLARRPELARINAGVTEKPVR